MKGSSLFEGGKLVLADAPQHLIDDVFSQPSVGLCVMEMEALLKSKKIMMVTRGYVCVNLPRNSKWAVFN